MVKDLNKFLQTWIEMHFGRFFFKKLLWSPCYKSRLAALLHGHPTLRRGHFRDYVCKVSRANPVCLIWTYQFWNLWLPNLKLQRQNVIHKIKYFFCFQNTIGYSWRCKFLQCWRCNSRLYLGLTPERFKNQPQVDDFCSWEPKFKRLIWSTYLTKACLPTYEVGFERNKSVNL
jgi:hypothetical protein